MPAIIFKAAVAGTMQPNWPRYLHNAQLTCGDFIANRPVRRNHEAMGFPFDTLQSTGTVVVFKAQT